MQNNNDHFDEPTDLPKEAPPTINQTSQQPVQPNNTAQKRKQRPLLKLFKDFLSFGAFVASIVLFASLINLFIFQSYYVDGTSMEPTLAPNDRLIVNKIPKTWANITNQQYTPQRGDIVVFDSPLTNLPKEQLIKRVIALPGEKIQIKDGTIIVYNQENSNGFKVDEELRLNLGQTSSDLYSQRVTTIPEDHIFVVGDNRKPGGSFDSREFGPIETSKLVGELEIRILPMSDAKFF